MKQYLKSINDHLRILNIISLAKNKSTNHKISIVSKVKKKVHAFKQKVCMYPNSLNQHLLSILIHNFSPLQEKFRYSGW